MIRTFFCAFLSVFGWSCGSNAQKENSGNNTTQRVSKATFKAQLAITENPLIIDIRTPLEFNQGHMEKAKNIDFFSSSFTNQLDSLDKEQVVFVYCRSGGRSLKSLKTFEKLGFKKVYELEGGFIHW